ncbi:conserved hypothetical protein [Theileria equi strain WA]|uniref:Uncharacterized protein n=1 Tax=Theileria equi strain WA TaxID=1537102 RepID=L1LDM2_THEEQ|nr:conserved hypothetical protein [Theileria equi strain WA]EKX73451.1 conserved hypothetical protein [Theileria equi strain WA]|eukprot:XP_004832903.1 conserved hypothetical protein [Theileria equi strain WA]
MQFFSSISSILRPLNLCSAPTLRKVVKHKNKPKTQEKVGVTRYLPYLPPGLVVDTVKSLKERESLSEILDLIFSPLKPTDTQEERVLYQNVYSSYKAYKQKIADKYLERQLFVEKEIFEAIQNLPENLYDEAVQSETEPIPEELTYQRAYRDQLINSELSDFEVDKLDAYRMLMYLRFPHLDIKKRSPGMFWIEEKKAISRQKQASLLARRKK